MEKKEFCKPTNKDVQKFLRTLRTPHFIGVFPCDMIPRPIRENECIILNTDPHNLPGKHYIAIYSNAGVYFYFDPLALDPSNFSIMNRELHVKNIAQNMVPVLRNPIQDAISNSCRLFCIDYVLSVTFPYQSSMCQRYTFEAHKLLKNEKTVRANISKWMNYRKE